MDLSFLGQSSKQLISSSRSSAEKENHPNSNYIDPATPTPQKSSASLLLESIKYKENQRLKSKIDRQLCARDDHIAQLTERCKRSEREAEKARNSLLVSQKDRKALSIQVNLLKQQLEEVKQSHRQKLQAEKGQIQGRMKEEIRSLEATNEQLKSSLNVQARQHELAMRRMQLQVDQTRELLSAKVIVKEKQLAKVQQALLNKKRQVEDLLNEKQLEIEELQLSRNQLLEQISTLTSELKEYQERVSLLEGKTNELEEVYQSELSKFNQQLQQKQAEHENAMGLFQVTVDCIQQAVKALMRQFELKEPGCEQIHDRIDNLVGQLKQKYEGIQSKEQLAKLRVELDSARSLELQLRHKVNILQEQLDFTRLNNTKNQNVASLIKQHLDNHQQTLIDNKQDKIKDFNLHSQINQHIKAHSPQHHPTQPQPTVHQKRTPKLTNNNSSINRQGQVQNVHPHQPTDIRSGFNYKSSPRPNLNQPAAHQNKANLVMYSIQSKLSTPQRQPISQLHQNQYQNLKQELTSKKKSLIYLMYKGKQQESSARAEPTTVQKQVHVAKKKQRSCSMGDLVRRRCQEHLL